MTVIELLAILSEVENPETTPVRISLGLADIEMVNNFDKSKCEYPFVNIIVDGVYTATPTKAIAVTADDEVPF